MASSSILIPSIKKFYPTKLAEELVSVQPMTGQVGSIFNIRNPFQMFSVLETKQVNGKMIYSVAVSDDITTWIHETFVSGKDYTAINNLKGVWFDMSEDAFVLLKLKWA